MKLYTLTSDGDYMPEGQYLITIDDDTVDVAWRPKPDTRIVWHPPIRATRDN